MKNIQMTLDFDMFKTTTKKSVDTEVAVVQKEGIEKRNKSGYVLDVEYLENYHGIKKMENSEYVLDINFLEDYCRIFLEEAYGLDLEIPVVMNNRLSRSLGRFVHSYGMPQKIEFATFYLKNGKEEQILSTARHECIHYALFALNKPYRDGDEYFENELKKYNSHSTGTQRVERVRNLHIYTCGCEGHEFTRVRGLKNQGREHTCTVCNERLKYQGKAERSY